MKKIKIREQNAIEIYRKRGQIINSTFENRKMNYSDGWFLFEPITTIINEDNSELEKYLFNSKKDYDNFLNDNTYLYPCCSQFSKY